MSTCYEVGDYFPEPDVFPTGARLSGAVGEIAFYFRLVTNNGGFHRALYLYESLCSFRTLDTPSYWPAQLGAFFHFWKFSSTTVN